MASGTITGTTSNQYISAKIEWEDLPDTATNSSTVYAKLYYKKSSASTTPTSGVINATITINGNKYTYNSGNSKTLPVDNKWYYITEHSVVVKHNTDGKKSITISATGGMSGSSFTSTSLSGTAVLTNIPRAATLTGAPDFADNTAPVITYSNPAGSAVTALEACISLTGALDDVPYRAVSKTGTSYTFYLTSDELKTLRDATSGNSRTVKFFLRTTIGTEKYYSQLSRTFTISNTSVTFSPVAYDTNSRTTALTGNSSYIVKGYSNLYYDMNTSVSSASTVSSRQVVCGGITKTSETGTFNATESATITMSATDSRGNSGTVTVNKTLINYFKPTLTLDIVPPSASGEMTLTVKGTFYNGSFGKVNNSLTCRYNISHEGSGYSSGSSFTLTKNGNSYTGTVTITGLNYKNVYLVSVNAYDELEEVQLNEVRTIGTPVYDWGKSDFKFNVDVECDRDLTVNGRIYKPNQILWSSTKTDNKVMVATDTVNLKYSDGTVARISEQTNGVVFIFSPKNVNEDWVCHFIPKQLVELQEGSGFPFQLSNAVYSNVGGKFLYIYDTYIVGWAWNDASGTGNGVSYNNNNWVLRYVIGV